MKVTQVLLNGIKKVKTWRDASSLLIAIPGSNCLQYLVTLRVTTGSFPGGLCFPGGTVSPSDGSKDWMNLYGKSGIDLTSLKLMEPGAKRPEIYELNDNDHFGKEITLRITAIRETFEECGILLCQPMEHSTSVPSNPKIFANEDEIRVWQNRIMNQPEDFLTLCDKFKILPNLSSLYEWNNWLTPTTFHPKGRFDTIFYITMLDKLPKIQFNSQEVTKCYISSPKNLIEDQMSGKEKLFPPQLYEMMRLKKVSNFEDLERLAKERLKHGLERWCSVFINTKEGLINVLPGDDLYPHPVDIYEKQKTHEISMTFAELATNTINHHRLHRKIYTTFIPGEKTPQTDIHNLAEDLEVLVNISAKYGQVYE